ncbi:hypothetical protein NDU88_002771 [Pleurodeles waltl]|uniref:Uncharacterized protein n=1 Tax=Pleurodeles waltl TaxID=8319 RepID=A0AAV7T3C4_PLEWA|nr:hypothetical protein NDU88_002771 [Pleurodeles waltl]
MDGYEIRITADFSRETNELRKGFSALRPRMRRLEVKCGLLEPARLWVTQNGVSKDFYNPEDLQIFLDGLQPQSMDTATPDWPLRPSSDDRSTSPPTTNKGGPDRFEPDHRLRGRDLERFAKTHDARVQVLQAVALHTQLSDRDKSRSP